MNINNKKKVWSLRYTPGNREADEMIENIEHGLGISNVTAKLIYNRGYKNAEDAKLFLASSDSIMHDPYLLKDMDKAVERIALALSSGEKITVYGDYDVDGVTSVTLIYLYLKSLGANIDYYIPLRAKEGYGLSKTAIDTLCERGTKLVVTVDTGITANKEVEYAKEYGIDMVITDHHECHGELPKACAVVNPHRPDCTYPFCELAGVGVVFKLACAYEILLNPSLSKEECVSRVSNEYIDLVAMGTVADVMPLVDENRAIVKLGLEKINEGARVGLDALIDAANNSNPTRPAAGVAEKNTQNRKKIGSSYISFSLAPRINAAGRISSAEKAVELLLETDPYCAALKAEELCEINTQRQKEENSICEQAYRMIEEMHDFENDKVIVLSDDSWTQGIIGIVSSRITEKYGLPSILISFDGAAEGDDDPYDVGKGSGRSVKGMNLVEALDFCKEHLVQFGGHELAAGLSLRRCDIDGFRKKINKYARESLSDELLTMKYEADCEIDTNDIIMKVAEEILLLEPFGVANAAPLFIVRDVNVEKVVAMSAGKHSKLFVNKNGASMQAVCFGMAASMLDLHFGERADLLCQLGINEFRGQKSLQLVVKDIRLSESFSEIYESGKARYKAIISGESFSESEDIIPTRAEIADVYKFLRYESMCGHTAFSYRTLHSALLEQMSIDLDCLKLRFVTRILADMNVCEIEESGDDIFFFEICQNAEKTNIEASKTYRALQQQRRA